MIEKIDKEIYDRSNLIMTVDAANDISKINLISTGSTTHAQGSELKYQSLNFEKIDETKILVKIPENKNIIQNGTYLIFALNSSNVPSEGEVIYLK